MLSYKLGFPTGRDSATFWDNKTEVLSLSQDKGQRDKLKILPRDGTGQDSQNSRWDVPGVEKDALKQENVVLKQKMMSKNTKSGRFFEKF